MTTLYDRFAGQLASSSPLTRDELQELADSHDILAVGMLADEVRRRTQGERVTFARVATCPFDEPPAEPLPPAARELRLTGAPPSLDAALAAVRSAGAVAGTRLLSGFSLADLLPFADGTSDEAVFQNLLTVLQRLRDEGLQAIAEVPVDRVPNLHRVLGLLNRCHFDRVCLTLAKPAVHERVAAVLQAAELAADHPIVRAINPLPMSLTAFRPTTGYEDVKVVALARLAAPPQTAIQVDWQRYGPKLAQVALTFGASDLDNVSPSGEAPDGLRRAPLEEVRRNIEAAGFTAVERDGRWSVDS